MILNGLAFIAKHGLIKFINLVKLSMYTKKYFRSYMLVSSICALSELKILDEILETSCFSFEGCKVKYDERTLKIVMDYLCVNNLMSGDGSRYSLTQKGREQMGAYRGVFDFITAYAPIFNNLTEIIGNKKKYGKDIFRKGEFVGRASAELAEFYQFERQTNGGNISSSKTGLCIQGTGFGSVECICRTRGLCLFYTGHPGSFQ